MATRPARRRRRPAAGLRRGPGLPAPGPPASAGARPAARLRRRHGGADSPPGAPGPAPSGRRRTGAGGGSARTREPASWSDAPPPPDTAPSWASPLEQAKATVAVEAEVVAAERAVVDDTAISDDDESIDDLTDVGVPVVERILGGTVIAEDPK